MKAAVVDAFGQVPSYKDFTDPVPQDGESIVTVKASSLKNIDKALLSGTHYASENKYPMIAGVDGVGVLSDGTRIYFGGVRSPYGTMAEKSIAGAFRITIPDDIDDITAAALPNPALSSLLPLLWIAKIQEGETVLVNGATGVAGQLAVQIAKLLGAGKIITTGRNEEILQILPELGADVVIDLKQSEKEVKERLNQIGRPHIILDYLWGHPTEILISSLVGHDLGAENSRVRLIQIGEMAGSTISLSADSLRGAGLEIFGSGGGSIAYEKILESFVTLWDFIKNDKLKINIEKVPLRDISHVWEKKDNHGQRIVFIP